jgi:hypothetical protein
MNKAKRQKPFSHKNGDKKVQHIFKDNSCKNKRKSPGISIFVPSLWLGL